MVTPNYSIDSRTIKNGEIFVAVKGDRYDGHAFIKSAISNGATGLVVEEDISKYEIPSYVEVIKVANSTEYLALEAKNRIKTLKPFVVGITGSIGKTTTKNAVFAVLKQAFPVITTPGNFNTLLGISLTVLNQIKQKDLKFVAEIGTYQIGNIARICQYIKPDISIVTQVQPVHLETMGTIENIALAKSELVTALDKSGTACLNYDDYRVREMSKKCKGQVVYYGTSANANITPEYITAEIPLIGSYKIYPAMAAYCVGQLLGLTQDTINNGLANLKPEKGRLSKLTGKNNSTILDDTYNASLKSTLASLDSLKNMEAQRRIAILGDMLELGSEEKTAHKQVIQQASQVADIIILIGERMQTALLESSIRGNVLANYKTSNEAVSKIAQVFTPNQNDLILIKGSAGVRMEHITKLFLSSDLNPKEVLVRQESGWDN